MQPILSANNIVKNYANHTALDRVSIEIPSNSIFGLLGPNGAGKTSLIRIINQITGPDSGEVLFNGEPLSPKHIFEIGYLPEERGLYKKMKVGEHAMYLAQLKGLSKAEALEKLKHWFDKFDITPWWNKRVEELSKGMQQKLQFIVTVIHAPSLLILDEPFSGFDPINTNLIKDEILALKQSGTSILFSTHNMESVEELCDHIALLDKSNKILGGSVEEVRTSFKSNRYQISFTGSIISFTNSLWTLGKLINHSTDNNLITAIVEVNKDVSPNQLLSNVMDKSEIRSFTELVPSMKEIFISQINNNKESIEPAINE